MNILDVINFLFQYNETTQEYLPVTDYAGILSLVILLGGVFFWMMVVVCGVLALIDAVRRLYNAAREVLPAFERHTAE